MKRLLAFLLLIISLCLTGCGRQAISSVDSSFSLYSEIESEESSGLVEASEVSVWDLLTDEQKEMTYEEYFSQERYVDWDTDYDERVIRNEWNWRQILLTDESKKIVLYEHPDPIENCLFSNPFLGYFQCGDSLYRMFIPTGMVEKIYQGDQDFSVYPITNYVTMILYSNPEFQRWLDYYGDAMPAGHPSPEFAYLYDFRDGNFVEYVPTDHGYNTGVPIVSIPLEEIRPLPKEESSSQ